jgi:hypothetical protein
LHGGCPGLLREQRHLAEQRALVQASPLDLAAALRREDAHLARRDQVERHAGLALADDEVAVGEAAQTERIHDGTEDLARQL